MGLVVSRQQLVSGVTAGILLVELGGDVILADVQRHELDIGILILRLLDGAAEGVAGHHDDGVALFHGLLDHGNTLSGAVAGRLVVVEVHAVGLAVSLAGLVGGLVEGLVGDIAVVGDHSDLFGRLPVIVGIPVVLTAAGDKGESHDSGQKQCKKLFHDSMYLPF